MTNMCFVILNDSILNEPGLGASAVRHHLNKSNMNDDGTDMWDMSLRWQFCEALTYILVFVILVARQY